MSDNRHKFEFLDSLIGGWIHQDFDIEVSNPGQIIASYKGKTKPAEQQGLASDIRNYLAEHPDDTELTKDFMQRFKPDLVEEPWGLTTREFRIEIENHLVNAYPSRFV